MSTTVTAQQAAEKATNDFIAKHGSPYVARYGEAIMPNFTNTSAVRNVLRLHGAEKMWTNPLKDPNKRAIKAWIPNTANIDAIKQALSNTKLDITYGKCKGVDWARPENMATLIVHVTL